MKKYNFWSGFFAGLAVSFLGFLLMGYIYNLNQEKHPSVEMFEEKGECLDNAEYVKVFQTLDKGYALARSYRIQKDAKEQFDIEVKKDDITVLLIGEDNQTYYDDLKIKIPTGKCLRQVGVYRYENVRGSVITVPAVVIE